MTPALALERQITRLRQMTGEERVLIALRLHELSCEIAREGIRHEHPDADADEIERRLRERIRFAYAR